MAEHFEETGSKLARVERSAADLAGFDSVITRRLLSSEHRPLSAATKKYYAADWKRWVAWCEESNLEPFPAEELSIRAYILHLEQEGLRFGSIRRVYWSIRGIHSLRSETLPTLAKVANTFREIATRIGSRPSRKRPLLTEHLKAIAPILSAGNLRDIRDLAMLLVGWAAALRRGELVALRVEDVSFEPEGLMLYLPRRKTDQIGRGSSIAVPAAGGLACPVRALRAWLDASGVTSGAIFRLVKWNRARNPLSGGEVPDIVRRAVKLIGVDPEGFGGHSLRRGLMTSGARAGKRLEELMSTSGHKNIAVAQAYIDNAFPFEGAASRGLLAGVQPPAEPAEAPYLRDKSRDLYARGYSVEQIVRFIRKATTTDVSEAAVRGWIVP